MVQAIGADSSGAAGARLTFISVDEAHTIRDAKAIKLWDELIPLSVGEQKVSIRCTTSHAGYTGQSPILENLYSKGTALPLIGRNLHAAPPMLFMWSHEPEAPHQTEAWLETQRQLTRSPTQYLRQFENRWVHPEAINITAAMYAAAERDALPEVDANGKKLPVFVGADVAPKRDDSCLIVATREGDGVRVLRHRIYTPTKSNPLDFESFIEGTLREWQQRYDIRLVLIDPSWMIGTAQRLRKTGLRVEELTPNTGNMTLLAQTIYDLFRFERITVYRSDKLRDIVTRTIFEETASGLRFAKKQSVKIDSMIALSLACYAAQRDGSKPDYQKTHWEPFSNDRLLNAPPPPDPYVAPRQVFANTYWWKSTQYHQPQTTCPGVDTSQSFLSYALQLRARGYDV